MRKAPHHGALFLSPVGPPWGGSAELTLLSFEEAATMFANEYMLVGD